VPLDDLSLTRFAGMMRFLENAIGNLKFRLGWQYCYAASAGL
jgi:hypothetical protein